MYSQTAFNLSIQEKTPIHPIPCLCQVESSQSSQCNPQKANIFFAPIVFHRLYMNYIGAHPKVVCVSWLSRPCHYPTTTPHSQ